MASPDVNHARTIGRSTISTNSKDSTGSDKPYTCFESVKVKNQPSNSIESSVKSTDSQCCSQCQEESRYICLTASHHSGPYENSVLPKTEEEIKASNRNIVHTNTQNEGRGLSKAGYADSGSYQTIPGDSLNSTKNIEDNNCVEKGHDNHGYADSGSSEDSLHSIFTDIDITSKEFMLRPDVHIPQDEHDLPRFPTPIGEQQYQPQKTECKIPWQDSEPWTQIHCSLSNETVIEPPTGINLPYNNEDLTYIADNRLFPNSYSSGGDSHYSDLEKHHKSKKNFLFRIMILLIVFLCISGVAAWVIQNKYFLGSKDTPTVIADDLPDFPDKCENDISIARVGEQICIPYTQKFTSRPSGIHVRQLSSQYLSVLQGFTVTMSSDAFEQKNGGWIINFNSSRPEQQLLFMKEKATCDSVGIYEIKEEYDDENVSSSKFEIKLKDPQLQHSVTRINESIHVHCEMIKTCVASSLALFVNDEGSSRMIPNINVCSDNHQESGTTVSADAIIPAAWLSGNMTISCIPLMTDPGLAANLTSTTRIPVCEGDCIPDCTDDPQSEAYFPDKNDCTKFYQCSNGKLVFQTCASTTYWSPSKCTCDHFDDEICNKDTNKFFKPLLSIEKCTKASLV